MNGDILRPLVAGQKLEGDWFDRPIPSNIEVGTGSVIDSAFCFKHYFAADHIGLRVGRNVTFWRTSIAADRTGLIEVGDDCYIANASLVSSMRITIGSLVMIAGGVTIADSDFHPLNPADRVVDSIALSPVGDRSRRPRIRSSPVVIEDEVWIGYNATILKGVRIGKGAMIAPGAVVSRNVAPGTVVAGNPAVVVRALDE